MKTSQKSFVGTVGEFREYLGLEPTYPCLLCDKVTKEPSCVECDLFVQTINVPKWNGGVASLLFKN